MVIRFVKECRPASGRGVAERAEQGFSRMPRSAADAPNYIVIVTMNRMVIGPFDNAQQADAFALRNGIKNHRVVSVLLATDSSFWA